MKITSVESLIQAIIHDDHHQINTLINQGIDINHPNHFNVTPLEMALKKANIDIVLLLLSAGAKLNINASYFYHQQLKCYQKKLHNSDHS